MNNKLDKIHIIQREQLSEENYFQSLLTEAHGKGILSDNDIEHMQYECLNLLACKTENYNGGDSSSIPVEKAQEFMASILFTTGLYLKTLSSPDDSIDILKNIPINELYQKGRKRINIMIMTAKTIHQKLLYELINTENVFYRSTLKDGILGFFKLYSPDYLAHEIHITADYPLCNHIPKFAGIEFIKAYIESAYLENKFCSYFCTEDIHHLLCGYADDYKELLINIYEFVLITSIGCVITGTDLYHLDITKTGVSSLQNVFNGQTKKQIIKAIKEAAHELNKRLEFSDELIRYIQTSLPLIADKIEFASKEHTLDKIFFTPSYPENNPKIIFSYGKKMEDDRYRKIVAEIGRCRFSQDKFAIVKKHIHSLADFEDVLLDTDLTDKETQNFLQLLTLPEIAALSKKYHLYDSSGIFELRDREQRLHNSLQRFISSLSPAQQELIAKAGEVMEEGEI